MLEMLFFWIHWSLFLRYYERSADSRSNAIPVLDNGRWAKLEYFPRVEYFSIYMPSLCAACSYKLEMMEFA